MIYESLILSIAMIVAAVLRYRLLSQQQAYEAIQAAQKQADYCKAMKVT